MNLGHLSFMGLHFSLQFRLSAVSHRLKAELQTANHFLALMKDARILIDFLTSTGVISRLIKEEPKKIG